VIAGFSQFPETFVPPTSAPFWQAIPKVGGLHYRYQRLAA
jgi:hypothetical protein